MIGMGSDCGWIADSQPSLGFSGSVSCCFERVSVCAA